MQFGASSAVMSLSTVAVSSEAMNLGRRVSALGRPSIAWDSRSRSVYSDDAVANLDPQIVSALPRPPIYDLYVRKVVFNTSSGVQ